MHHSFYNNIPLSLSKDSLVALAIVFKLVTNGLNTPFKLLITNATKSFSFRLIPNHNSLVFNILNMSNVLNDTFAFLYHQ